MNQKFVNIRQTCSASSHQNQILFVGSMKLQGASGEDALAWSFLAMNGHCRAMSATGNPPNAKRTAEENHVRTMSLVKGGSDEKKWPAPPTSATVRTPAMFRSSNTTCPETQSKTELDPLDELKSLLITQYLLTH